MHKVTPPIALAIVRHVVLADAKQAEPELVSPIASSCGKLERVEERRDGRIVRLKPSDVTASERNGMRTGEDGKQLYAGCNTRRTLILPAFFSICARS